MIHLVGPGVAGKTTAGAALAERLGVAFVDLDAEFAADSGDVTREEYEIQFSDICNQIMVDASGNPINVVNPKVFDVLKNRTARVDR
jgi:shikimate kinase